MQKNKYEIPWNRVRQPILCILLSYLFFFFADSGIGHILKNLSVNDFRLSIALHPVFGLLFGWPGALGAALGSLTCYFEDLSAIPTILTLLVFLDLMLLGMFPGLCWKRWVGELRLDSVRNYFRYLMLILADSVLSGGFIFLSGSILQNAGLGSILIILHDFAVNTVLGIPIILFYTLRKYSLQKLKLNERFTLNFMLLSIPLTAFTTLYAYVTFRYGLQFSTWEILLSCYYVVFVITMILTVLMILILHFLEDSFVGPVEMLSKVTSEDILGNEESTFEAEKILEKMQVDPRGSEEVRTLTNSYRFMLQEIQREIDQLKLYIQEKEAVEAELRIARDIQMGALRQVDEEIREDPRCRLRAVMHPAKEVGGDFYDMFFIDEDHLAILIADVSGKGITAALFMMLAKTVLRRKAMGTDSPAEIFRQANELICQNNKKGMFVTVWLGILDLNTGEMQCSSAGHEYPLLMRKGEDYEFFKDRHSFVLGTMEGVRFREYSLTLQPGDRILVYTDGVIEAQSDTKEQYGAERTLALVNRLKNRDCGEMLDGVYEGLMAFTGSSPQFDDITLLQLELV